MRKLAIGLALASTVLATPSLARDRSFYAGLEGGLMIIEDATLFAEDGGDGAVLNHNKGFDIGAIAGYDAGSVRLEGELAFKRASLDYLGTSFGTEISSGGDASARAFSLMANVLADFDTGSGWSGFVGPGIGIARTTYGLEVDDLPEDFREGEDFTDTGLAWQVVAGVRRAITPMMDVGLKYRYFRVPNLSDDLNGENYNTSWTSHSLLLSLVYNFGPPPVAPVYVAPPPPVIAPATQTCPDGTVILATEVCPAPPPPPPPPGERG